MVLKQALRLLRGAVPKLLLALVLLLIAVGVVPPDAPGGARDRRLAASGCDETGSQSCASPAPRTQVTGCSSSSTASQGCSGPAYAGPPTGCSSTPAGVSGCSSGASGCVGSVGMSGCESGASGCAVIDLGMFGCMAVSGGPGVAGCTAEPGMSGCVAEPGVSGCGAGRQGDALLFLLMPFVMIAPLAAVIIPWIVIPVVLMAAAIDAGSIALVVLAIASIIAGVVVWAVRCRAQGRRQYRGGADSDSDAESTDELGGGEELLAARYHNWRFLVSVCCCSSFGFVMGGLFLARFRSVASEGLELEFGAATETTTLTMTSTMTTPAAPPGKACQIL